MFRNNFKFAWRNLLKSRLFGVITITGLGISMATCLLIYAYVKHELSFDQFNTRKDRIYRLNELANYPGQSSQLSSSVAQVMAPYFYDNAQGQIDEYVRVAPAQQPITQPITLTYGNRKVQPKNLAYSEPSLFRVFDFEVLAGDRRTLLTDRRSFVITQTVASTLFGDESPLNKVVQFDAGDTTYSMRVAGVLADLPRTSHLQVDGLLPLPQTLDYGLHENYGVMLESTYFLIRPGVDVAALQATLDKVSKLKSKYIDIRLQPLSDVHLGSTDTVYDTFNDRKTDRQYVYIFSIVGLLIFGISCINFINLTIAKASYRGKEIGVKRVIGAARRQIYMQFISESLLSTGLALLVAIGLAVGLLPWFNQLLGRELFLSPLSLLPVAVSMIGLATFSAGIYPAWVLTSFSAVQTLAGKLHFNNRRLSFGKGLIIGQFTIAIGLTIATLIAVQQLQYMQTSDPGFQRQQIIGIKIGYQANSKLEALTAELRKQSGVIDITASALRLGGTLNLNGVRYRTGDGQQTTGSFSLQDIAPNYLSFYGIKITKGRDAMPDAENQYFVNETFVRKAGWKQPIGQPISYAWLPDGVVAGVVKDFHFNTLHERIEPVVMRATRENGPINELSVKLSGNNIPATLTRLEATWGKLINDQTFAYQFLDQHFDNLYRADQQAGIIIGGISGLAIFIACLGLFSLSAFSAQRRTKEIGVRKVLGASVATIVTLLSKDFLKLVLIAIVIASPVAWYVMNRWLQDFAYKIDIAWWVFALAGLLAVGIALLTVGFQSIKAALMNPVKSLRSE